MRKNRPSKTKLAELARKIEAQRKRAARPNLPVNTHAPVSKSLGEKRESLARKSRQRKTWDET